MKNSKYIITEEQLRLVKESIDIENIKLPDFIVSSIKQHKTSLGEHDAFPPGNELPFQEKILKKRYYEVLTNVKKVDGIDGDISKVNLLKKLKYLVIKCKEIEEPIKNDLEKICFELVNDIFGIEYGKLNIECNIIEDIKLKQNIVPNKLEDDFFEDIEHIENSNKEVMKRRLINSLVQGACVRLSSNINSVINKIYLLDQRLPELYYNITAINEYLSFIKEIKPSENNIGGTVSVDLSNEETKITSDAIIFPVLVFETIKGIMELFSAHGLPDNKNDAEFVLNQSDFLLAENWDKRFGVGMWDILMSIIKLDNIDILPQIFVELVTIPVDTFNKVMQEIFAKTKKGQNIIDDIINGIYEEQKFNEIENTVKTNYDSEFIDPDELMLDVVTETDTASVGNYTYDAPAFLDDETADHSNMIAKSINETNTNNSNL